MTANTAVYLQILFAIVRAIVKPEPTAPASAIESVARRPERPIGWSVDDSAELYQVNA